MRKLILAALLATQAVAAYAGGSATITCGNAAPGVYNNGQAPVLHINYTAGVDAGAPGLFWLGVLSPDQTRGAVLTQQGWATYQGGMYPFQARYDNGIPGTVTVTIPFPTSSLSTAGFVGFSVYAGHGVYTPRSQEMVAQRRAMLNSIRAQRIAAGTWSAEYETDDRYIWSLIQGDMVNNNKFGAVITVPFIDCTPPQQ
jgi:hypothetical protein